MARIWGNQHGGWGVAAQFGEVWGGGVNSTQGRDAPREQASGGRDLNSASERGLAQQRGRERSTGASGGASSGRGSWLQQHGIRASITSLHQQATCRTGRKKKLCCQRENEEREEADRLRKRWLKADDLLCATSHWLWQAAKGGAHHYKLSPQPPVGCGSLLNVEPTATNLATRLSWSPRRRHADVTINHALTGWWRRGKRPRAPKTVASPGSTARPCF